MTDAKVLVERRGTIALVTLNDPANRNALTPAIVGGLASFFEEASKDDELTCIVLAAAGEGFCSGGNIKDMLAKNDKMYSGTAQQQQEGYRRGIQAIPKLLDTLDIPVIAAVQGHAIGAGCDLASMCDIRIASPEAKFAESFLRVGLVPGDGGAWFLPRLIGVSRAMEMALTCRMIDAEQAREWGLVNHVVPKDKLVEFALEMAGTISTFPPLSIRLNKRLIRRSLNTSLVDCLELSAAFQAMVQSTADQREAVAALVEKRAPKFKRE